jgi:hypothetical protein
MTEGHIHNYNVVSCASICFFAFICMFLLSMEFESENVQMTLLFVHFITSTPKKTIIAIES